MGDSIYVLNKAMKRHHYPVPTLEEIADDIVVHERMSKNTTCTCMKLRKIPGRQLSSSMTRSVLSRLIMTKECNFFGMQYTPDGVRLCTDKIRAIEELKQPKPNEEIRFLETYVSLFIPYCASAVPAEREC